MLFALQAFALAQEFKAMSKPVEGALHVIHFFAQLCDFLAQFAHVTCQEQRAAK